MDWDARRLAYLALVEERERAAAAPDPAEGREDFQVAALATACWAAGLASLMAGRTGEAGPLLGRAADVYRQSYDLAPAGSWGRPLAALRCRLIGDADGAGEDARWALTEGAAAADSAVGRYAGALAHLVLGQDAEAGELARGLQGDGGLSPRSVADALLALATRSQAAYAAATEELLADFEARAAFLEDVAVADTVLVLDRLAGDRGLASARRPSALLP